MGRELMRVPMSFDFPIGSSFADHAWNQHARTCTKNSHDDCDVDWRAMVPKGDGWQLWQTVSDGPISPVFATADELIDWMSKPDYEPRRYGVNGEPGYPDLPWAQGWRREAASAFVLGKGWIPSMAIIDGRPLTNGEVVDHINDGAKHKHKR